jgi:3' exoribonuclease, RNase T-like
MNRDEPKHYMIDIETLDTVPSAVILSIGACEIRAEPGHGSLFYEELHVATQYERTSSNDTIEWWKTQKYCPDQGSTGIALALQRLHTYLRQDTDNPIVWCKGTDFDICILAHAYKQYGQTIPWKYSSVRDFRTIKKLFAGMITSDHINTDPHNALADAIHQTRQLVSMELELL